MRLHRLKLRLQCSGWKFHRGMSHWATDSEEQMATQGARPACLLPPPVPHLRRGAGLRVAGSDAPVAAAIRAQRRLAKATGIVSNVCTTHCVLHSVQQEDSC